MPRQRLTFADVSRSLLSVMWAVGINQSSSILFSLPKSEGGYGMGLNAIGYLTFSPIIAVAIGETLGHWGNDVSPVQALVMFIAATEC
jgi:hypothetical protein